MKPTTDEQARPGLETADSPSPCLRGEWVLLWILGLVLILAVSRQSLWIDEFYTASNSSHGSLREWGRGLATGLGSNLQTPGYMFYMWGWIKVAGDSEWALRAAGLIWLVPGLVLMASGFPRRTQRMAVMLAAVTSAFVWYYAGEARPYAMQLGVSCLVFAALQRLSREELSERQQSRWLTGYLAGFFLLCASNSIGAICAIGALAAAFILIPRRRLLDLWKTGWRRLVLTGLLLLVLGLFYVWTLSVGARASAAGATNWKTVAFVFYEQLGLTGLGPGRVELRQTGIQTLRPYIIQLTVYFVLIAIVVAGGVRQALRQRPAKQVCALVPILALPALLLFGVGFAVHFRVLGRHLTPLMPIWFSLLGLGLATLWGRAGWTGKAICAAYMVLSLCSCLSIRLAVRHERDDYRDAAQYAKLALRQNQVVWWNADLEGAWYYKVPLASNGEAKNVARLVNNPPDETLAGLPPPQVIVASKPDLYDDSGALARYIAGHGFHLVASFPAFHIWGAKESKE